MKIMWKIFAPRSHRQATAFTHNKRCWLARPLTITQIHTHGGGIYISRRQKSSFQAISTSANQFDGLAEHGTHCPAASRDTRLLPSFTVRWDPEQRVRLCLLYGILFLNRIDTRSDTDRSEIIAPVPRKHLTIQRNESQHWLGSPPLSPVSTTSRALSPLHTPLTSTLSFNRRHLSISTLRERDLTASLQFSGTHSRVPSGDQREDDSSPGRIWVRWLHKHGLKQLAVPVIVLVCMLIRWAIGLSSYSGECALSSSKPVHAKANAHAEQDTTRHQCMEITKRSDTGWN